MGCNKPSFIASSIIRPSSRNTPKSSYSKPTVRPSTFVFHKTSSIQNDYSLGPILGIGAFGSVRIAANKLTSKECAIKTIQKSKVCKDSNSKSKFLSEIEILKTLDHPNVVRLFEFYQDSTHYHIVTELLRGGELFEYLSSSQNLSESTAAYFMKQLLQAVNYCHSKGIVHRDLKPENLLMDSKRPDAVLKIIDFGMSIKYDGAGPLKAAIGTCHYMAPEVINKRYTEKCDIWSCGVILFVMLSGHTPFSGENIREIQEKIKTGIFSFNCSEWEQVSEEAKDLVRKMMELDPAQRLSAEQALEHEWFKKNESSNNTQSIPSVLKNLTEYSASQKIHHAVLTYISTQLVHNKELKELAEVFTKIDKNGDGKLSKEELLEEIEKYMDPRLAQAEVEKILKTVDNDQNGFIDYSEFLVAAVQKEKAVSKKNLEVAFKMFDINGNGSIGAEEIRSVLREDGEGVWEEISGKLNKKENGGIDLNEFYSLMVEGVNNM